jgi:tRNA-dihydrouridine synthase
MQGITSKAYRELFFARFPGFSRAYAPFIRSVPDIVSSRHFKDLLGEADAPYELVPQIICNDPGELACTAAQIADLGYREMNVNMGCPYPMVAHKKRGSGILSHPELIDRMLGEGLPRCPIPVSVKLRLGRHDPAESKAVFEVLNRYPLAEVILHPRTGIQMYSGSPDLERFAECLALSHHPLTYNGDILTREGFRGLAARFPAVRRWMIGRGALRDPFLGSEILGRAPSWPERLAALESFRRGYEESFERRFGRTKQYLDSLKGFWAYLAWSFPRPEERLAELRRVKRVDDYEAWADSLFMA